MTKFKQIISYTILVIASFLSAFPLYYMLCGATNQSIDVVRGRLIPGTYLIENFKTLVDMQNLGLAMFNSFRNAIVITVVTLLICSIAGYGFEIYHDKGKDILMSILLLAMMLPFVAIMIPLFKMFTSWKLVNTWIALAPVSYTHLTLPTSDDGYIYECVEQLSVADDHFTGQQGDHHADVSSQSEEWIQCGLWYADAGSIDLYTSYSDYLPVFTEELCKWNYGSSEIMQQKMPKQETMTQAHIRKAQGAFLLAHRMGLIEDPTMEGLETRRQKHNEELRRMEQEGQRFYGPHYFSAPAYLQYELTRLKLDFVQPCEKVREGGFCPDFTEQEKRDFYEQNRDLFGRYHGDYFTYEEVSQIIEKRLREDAYDKLICDILCESENRQ